MSAGETVLEGLEQEAREGRRGLWTDPQPVPPWEWRQGRVACHQWSWATCLDTSLTSRLTLVQVIICR
jgi:hypothetical protein